jgi:hypothetical protein
MTKLAEIGKRGWNYFLWACAMAAKMYFEFHGMPAPEFIGMWMSSEK